jgi:hypothetical protein
MRYPKCDSQDTPLSQKPIERPGIFRKCLALILGSALVFSAPEADAKKKPRHQAKTCTQTIDELEQLNDGVENIRTEEDPLKAIKLLDIKMKLLDKNDKEMKKACKKTTEAERKRLVDILGRGIEKLDSRYKKM